ncbi:MAG TPA: NfeD family protein [Methanothermobacter sp.]|nr:NfeD family protein [Methanothermobacter sp.]HPQ03954.1 NfeD family protein [Methanothermobacter sp.]
MVGIMDYGSWIIIGAVCLIGEMLTTGFFLLWFGIGAFVAAALSYFGFNFTIQFVAFILVSVVLLGVSRPFASKVSKEPQRRAVADRLIGQTATVMEDFEEEGLIKVDGETWRAKSQDKIKKGDKVIIKGIDGVKLIVEKYGR